MTEAGPAQSIHLLSLGGGGEEVRAGVKKSLTGKV